MVGYYMSAAVEQIKGYMQSANFDGASIEKIMDKFIVKDKNLILKTSIEDSIKFTALMVIQEDLKVKGLKKSAQTLKNFIDRYIEVRVSDSRLSRTEILDAISAIKREQNSSLTSKLLGMNDKEGKK